jgi:Phosphotransferase system cellobiose-specific component IIC
MKKVIKFFEDIENISAIKSIRDGVIMVTPVVLVGSFSLVIKSLPIFNNQQFIATFFGSLLFKFFSLIYNATFGMLSVYMNIAISASYSRLKLNKVYNLLGAPITSIVCFFILIGISSGSVAQGFLGAKGILAAIFSSVVASIIYSKISNNTKGFKLLSQGVDFRFNGAVSVMIPFSVVVGIFSVFNLVIITVFKVYGFQELIIGGTSWIFMKLGASFMGGLTYIFVLSLFWFFGIHGNNVLAGVNEILFGPGIEINEMNVALGNMPTKILTNEFFDVFVLIGGCGTLLSLLIAIFLFGKLRASKCLGKIAAIPMLFNINELMVFGFPIIFNPVMLIPFLLTPVVSFLTTYTAMATGIVPLTIHSVEGTTPVILGGYIATGSVRGSLLQIFNVLIGVAIYAPFVKIYEQKKINRATNIVTKLVELLKESELSGKPVVLTELRDNRGAIANMLAVDLKYAIGTEELALYYQPQHNNKGKCIGAEALLRWKHNVFGMMYPPLAIQLAHEMGFLSLLEKHIVTEAIEDIRLLKKQNYSGFKISVNVSGGTIQTDDFELFLDEKFKSGELEKGDICVEVTEQMALQNSGMTQDRFKRIRHMGYLMAIDDFSMGHTSLKYLQENQFDIVKLDGELVKGMNDNSRCKDIIASIIYLSKGLGFKIMAEYVETEMQRSELEKMGCVMYQGYLYSEAIRFDKFIEYLKITG